MDLSSLNEQQLKAVTQSINNNTIVTAGAGSGKSRVLTYRIGYLIDDIKVLPESIMAFTFTNKAAGEIKDRLSNMIPNVNKVWLGTFHSVCVRILKQFGHELGINTFTIMDVGDSRSILRQAFKMNNVATEKSVVTAYANKISDYKNKLINPITASSFAKDPKSLELSNIYKSYQSLCWGNKTFDFDDLIVYTVVLLQKRPVVRQWFIDNIKYVLTDESQDTNHAQFELIKLLVNNNNLFMVGDPDQTIFSWRGANSTLLTNYNTFYPNTQLLKLECNYRSTQTIVNASNRVIKNNTNRIDKVCFSNNSIGDPIIILEAKDHEEEATWVVREIAILNKQGIELDDIAVIYRTNAQSRSLEDKFMSIGVKYKIIGGISFYERKEIKDILAAIKTSINPKDHLSLTRVLKALPGIGAKTLDNIIKHMAPYDDLAFGLKTFCNTKVNLKVKASLVKLINMYELWATCTGHDKLIDMVDAFIHETGYRQMLIEEDSQEAFSRLENIDELKAIIHQFQDENPNYTVDEFINQISLMSDIDEAKDGKYVSLMTIHSAKGLEFKYVFMPGCEENILPHYNCMMGEHDLEEERRLFYVAMTRAGSQLYISHAKARYMYDGMKYNDVSRFITEIPEEYVMNL